MSRCLLIIDIQNDYFPAGAYPLVEPEAAASAAASVLERFRAAALPVIHVQHAWDDPDADFMKPGTRGARIHSSVAPLPGEAVVTKNFPNAFRGTNLAQLLNELGITDLVVAGMMTSMCVDATVRAGSDAGFAITVVADACASPDLEFGGHQVAARDVQAAYLASIASDYAEVVQSDALDIA